jgi:hypothetical protein
MDVEFQYNDEEQICVFHNVQSPNFNIGDEMTLNVEVGNEEVWDVKEHSGDFKIEKIEHWWKIRYPYNGYVDSIQQVCIMTITVIKL